MATRQRTTPTREKPTAEEPSQQERSIAQATQATEREGHRAVTLNLPFVTAQFRAPSREDLDTATRGIRSMLPSRSAVLFYGGLAATAALGAIEWPVAAAIGIGSALAGRGATRPESEQQSGKLGPSTSGDGPARA